MEEGQGRCLDVRKGAWTREEDDLLKHCINKYGEGNWNRVPQRAGLNRCRKSCRMRWLNYLKPDVNNGEFMEDEVDLLIRLHKLLGNRWSLIAGRLPGRTANCVKNYWNTHLRKKVGDDEKHMKVNDIPKKIQIKSNINRPRPWKSSKHLHRRSNINNPINIQTRGTSSPVLEETRWCEEELLPNFCIENLEQHLNIGDIFYQHHHQDDCWGDYMDMDLWGLFNADNEL